MDELLINIRKREEENIIDMFSLWHSSRITRVSRIISVILLNSTWVYW